MSEQAAINWDVHIRVFTQARTQLFERVCEVMRALVEYGHLWHTHATWPDDMVWDEATDVLELAFRDPDSEGFIMPVALLAMTRPELEAWVLEEAVRKREALAQEAALLQQQNALITEARERAELARLRAIYG